MVLRKHIHLQFHQFLFAQFFKFTFHCFCAGLVSKKLLFSPFCSLAAGMTKSRQMRMASSILPGWIVPVHILARMVSLSTK